ncbi:MAG: CvpA family protein [Flavobacteriales bacterium]|nr:CvpA family protein [Flavobacteriales bacterium]
MNWLDWAILIMLGLAAVQGFSRGFIVELASLVALVAGIWAATHFSSSVAAAIGLDPAKEILAFVVTFLLVLIGVHLLARFLTTLLDAAELGLPNKLSGIFFGVLRSAFTLSIALNLVLGYSKGDTPPKHVQEGSQFFEPLRAFAPLIIPALAETKWVHQVMEDVKEEAELLTD